MMVFWFCFGWLWTWFLILFRLLLLN